MVTKTDTLTETQDQTAHAIAQQLVLDGTDVNELNKAIAYLRTIVNQENAGQQFFSYLKTLSKRGDAIGHSKKTVGYYRSIEAACDKRLSEYAADSLLMLKLLGWAARLVKYYQDGVPTGELKIVEPESERKHAIRKAMSSSGLSLGKEIDAVITAIKGNKVTYEIAGVIRLTQKEPKQANSLSVGQQVRVEVTQLKDMNTIKKVKLLTESI